ncbi:hypothetical protein BJY52DRAFT_737812 [Lactarius psammicola]|nr:hypothetical protein BJY52DRAFT_737812 [Lactarius psammicola]
MAAESWKDILCVPSSHIAGHMSTGNTRTTLQPSGPAANTLNSNDDTPVRYDRGKERSNVSCDVLHRRLDAVCSWTYNQPFRSRPDTPSLANSVPDPDERPSVVQSASPSHGCQCQHLPYPSRRANPYSDYSTRSVAYCPLSRFPVPRQCGPQVASLSPCVSWEDESPFDEPQDGLPSPYLAKDTFLSASSFLASGPGFGFPVSSSLEALFIQDGRQILVPPASDAPVTDIFPGSCEGQQLPEVSMHTPASMAVPIDTNRYPADNAGMVVASNGFQDSNSRALNGPACAPPPEPEPQLCSARGQVIPLPSRSSPVHNNDPLVAPSIPSTFPPGQSRSSNTTERYEKKNWCPLCKIDFSQSQVLGRHIKDKHNTKESCSFCTSFKWSRGRPYLYRNHLRMKHPHFPPPDVRQKGSKTPKEYLNLHALSTRLQSPKKLTPCTGK